MVVWLFKILSCVVDRLFLVLCFFVIIGLVIKVSFIVFRKIVCFIFIDLI